jgi:hypothetical protein
MIFILEVMICEEDRGIAAIVSPVSSFKLEILRSLMGQASLFEDTG